MLQPALLFVLLSLLVTTAVTSCPTRCSCARTEGETSVNCQYQRLTAVPGDFPEDTGQIDLSYNDIAEVDFSVFSGLNKLKSLQINNCAVDTLTVNDSLVLPSLQTLVLSSNIIGEIPPKLYQAFPNLTSLQLEGNVIQGLQFDAFGSLFLQTCSLAYNNISTLQGTLYGLSIVTLDLSHNQLSDVTQTLISNNSVLETLNLAFNPLTRLPDRTFADIELKTLNLRNCSLTSHTFLRYTHVQHLDLSGNGFENLDFSQYASLRTLESLVFNGYNIFEFHRNTFQTMVNLKALDLTNNNLILMDYSPFQDLLHLEQLILTRNQLAELPMDLCSSFSKLKKLQLNMNQIEIIVEENFQGCTSLTSLDLRNNRLQVFPETVKPMFDRLTELHLADNPLHCNCEMLWFYEWVQSKPIFTGADYCETPNKDYLFYLKPHDFICTPPVITYHSADLVTSVGGEVVLRCTAEGDPAPEIDWLSPHGEFITVSPPYDRTVNLTQASWRLHDVHNAQTGLYKCIAKNPAGNVTANMTLTIGDLTTANILPTANDAQNQTNHTTTQTMYTTQEIYNQNSTSNNTTLLPHNSSTSSTFNVSLFVDSSTSSSVNFTISTTSAPSNYSVNYTAVENITTTGHSVYNDSSVSSRTSGPTTSDISTVSDYNVTLDNTTAAVIYNKTETSETSTLTRSANRLDTTSSSWLTRNGDNITSVDPVTTSSGELTTEPRLTTRKPRARPSTTVMTSSANSSPGSLVETRSSYTDRGKVMVIAVGCVVAALLLLVGTVTVFMLVLKRKESKQLAYEINGHPSTSTEAICPKIVETEA